MKIESYKTEKLKVEKDLNEMTKKSDLISWIRVALFILIMGLLSYGYFKKIKYKKSKIQVYQKYIKRLNGTWYDFKEKGTEYLDENMPYLKDLDIFGEGSLYQYICSANTIYGKKSLVKHLKQNDYNLDYIIKHQEAVKELSNMQDFAN